MKALEKFVEQKNHWNSFFNGPQYNLNSYKDRQALADMIDASLSPENLTCDGELSRSQVNQKFTYLNRCAAELVSIDPEVQFYEYN